MAADKLKQLQERLASLEKLKREAERLTDKAAAGSRNRQGAAARSRKKSEDVRDIGRIPPVADPVRRNRGRESFARFCKTYFPHTFTLEFSEDHRRVIAKIERAVLVGDLFAMAMPRGAGKSSIAEVAGLWAVLYGHRPYVLLIGASADNAKQMLESIKTELEGNDLLLADFPETVYPAQCLEGEPRRCKGQTYIGQDGTTGLRTQTTWSAAKIVLPTVEGSPASGAVIKTVGITGGFRGLKHKRPNGTSIRPSLVIADDPQTDASASSVSQCVTRERIVAGAVLGLAGPGKKIAGVMPCTVIRKDDMADRILDVEKHPEWNGTRCKLVYEFPTDQQKWAAYKDLLHHYNPDLPGDKERAYAAATAHYGANREAMDAGAVVAWAERFNPDELSAIQHAMNLRFRDERAFFAEFQNEPLPERAGDIQELTADQVVAKLNRMPRLVAPIQATRLTAFIDVQQSVLYYAILASADDFTCWLIDYGTWPDQQRSYFVLGDVQKTLTSETGVEGFEGQLYAGLSALTSPLLAREWQREGGSGLRVERCMIDANWGQSTDVIYQFCRQSPHAATLMPSHGKFVGASSNPITVRQKKPGETVGLNWVIPVPTKRAIRHILYDTNWWKSFLAARLTVAMGSPGCLSLFGENADTHRMLADHLTSEYRVRVEAKAKGRVVDEWRLAPGRDNHWLDCYSEDMEALTRDGWMPFSDLTGDEELATVNLETDLIEYQRPTVLIAKSYEGEMVQIGGGKYSRLDMLVTPNHRMVLFVGQASKGPVIREAHELTIWDKIKTSATWRGDGRSTYAIPATGSPKMPEVCLYCKSKLASRARGLCWGCYYSPGVKEQYQKTAGRRGHDGVTVCARDLAAFLGWYIAEGSCRINPGKRVGKSGHTHVVAIAQNPGAKRDEICGLLDRLPWKYHTSKVGVVLSNEQVYRLVCDLGNKYTKRVPQWIKDAGPDVISEFIRCAVSGDGWRTRGQEAYATVSPGLADDMMELYLKTGYAVSLRTVGAKAYCIRGRAGAATQCRTQYHIHRKTTGRCYLRDFKNRPNFRRVPYDGMIYCASVPNGTLIVRRNGKVAICGNCAVGAAVAASVCGSSLENVHARTRQDRQDHVSFAEMQRKARGGR